MNKTKHTLLKTPEYLLILSVIFYWTSTAVVFNPIAITLIILLGLQIKFQNKTVGILIPTFLILSSLFLIGALISEFNEFPTFNYEAKQLLFVGLIYFISTIVVSGIMIYKYGIHDDLSDQIEIIV